MRMPMERRAPNDLSAFLVAGWPRTSLILETSYKLVRGRHKGEGTRWRGLLLFLWRTRPASAGHCESLPRAPHAAATVERPESDVTESHILCVRVPRERLCAVVSSSRGVGFAHLGLRTDPR